MPIFEWGRSYTRRTFASDLLAALIVTMMLIPQSLAYAMLAGLPPEIGLYASILPLVAYGLFGSSRTLAVGPVAVISLMTAAAVGRVAQTGTTEYIAAAALLALLSGLFLVLMGFFRMGFLANFLSHPVISGFISASGILIACSQLANLLGITANGDTLIGILHGIVQNIGNTSTNTLALGASVLLFLFWARSGLKNFLLRIGIEESTAGILSKAGPIFGIIATSLCAWFFSLDEKGVALVGPVTAGLPGFAWPGFTLGEVQVLLLSAVLISIVGFVESVSVGHTLAARRRERIQPNQELIGLGAANVGAAMCGGFPVTGGFTRSVVNYDAGAQTPAAGIFTAVGIALSTLFLTGFLAYLPKATLAATIIVAVLSLVDFSIIRRSWRYSRADFTAVVITIVATLVWGVEIGVACGVFVSLALHLYKTTQPHMAVVGEVPGTEHFRNVNRHKVHTNREILSLRIDESLYFANARYIEEKIYSLLEQHPQTKHVILMSTAVNEIDISALEVLESINHHLAEGGITLHLSEVKGPVMDMLQRSSFLDDLSGRVFLSQHIAVSTLLKELYGETGWMI